MLALGGLKASFLPPHNAAVECCSSRQSSRRTGSHQGSPSVYELPGATKPSIFLTSSPLVCKSGRGQPPQRLMGKHCLYGQNQRYLPSPLKAGGPSSSSERNYQVEQGLLATCAFTDSTLFLPTTPQASEFRLKGS